MMNNNNIDFTFISDFCGGDKRKMSGYIKTFLDSIEEQIIKIRQFTINGNCAAVKSEAHSLKPQLEFLGLKELHKLIIQIEEESGENGNYKFLDQLTLELESKAKQTAQDLYSALINLS